MPSDRELSEAALELQNFRIAQQKYVQTETDLLQRYEALIQDHKRLQADYDEARDSRDNYKKLSRGADRNPFVLFLIDADGYVFDDDLISGGAEGGTRAAQLLNDAVKRSLVAKGLEHCRVMVRAYANLVGLSKALSKVKLCGPEKRSLAPFAAGFNRSNDLFDFVDAGELKENADYKIRAMLRQFVDNTQCRHIYFAACHDVAYVSELTPHLSNRQRITLVHNYALHHEFPKLGFPVEHLAPNVFRKTPLGEQATMLKPANVEPMTTTPLSENEETGKENAPICYFYQKGKCAFGKSCKKRHIKAPVDDLKDWRQAASSTKTKSPFDMVSISNSADNEYTSGNGSISPPAQADLPDPATVLPRQEDVPPNTIPVNAQNQRLDPYISTTSEDRAVFMAMVAKQKLCNSLHLTGHCYQGSSCRYDHTPLSDGLRDCLQQLAYNIPCASNKQGSCRNLQCQYGHVCQRPDCKYRGGKSFCRHSPAQHTMDLKAHDYVLGHKDEGSDPSLTSRAHHESMLSSAAAEDAPSDDEFEASGRSGIGLGSGAQTETVP